MSKINPRLSDTKTGAEEIGPISKGRKLVSKTNDVVSGSTRVTIKTLNTIKQFTLLVIIALMLIGCGKPRWN